MTPAAPTDVETFLATLAHPQDVMGRHGAQAGGGHERARERGAGGSGGRAGGPRSEQETDLVAGETSPSVGCGP